MRSENAMSLSNRGMHAWFSPKEMSVERCHVLNPNPTFSSSIPHRNKSKYIIAGLKEDPFLKEYICDWNFITPNKWNQDLPVKTF